MCFTINCGVTELKFSILKLNFPFVLSCIFQIFYSVCELVINVLKVKFLQWKSNYLSHQNNLVCLLSWFYQEKELLWERGKYGGTELGFLNALPVRGRPFGCSLRELYQDDVDWDSWLVQRIWGFTAGSGLELWLKGERVALLFSVGTWEVTYPLSLSFLIWKMMWRPYRVVEEHEMRQHCISHSAQSPGS